MYYCYIDNKGVLDDCHHIVCVERRQEEGVQSEYSEEEQERLVDVYGTFRVSFHFSTYWDGDDDSWLVELLEEEFASHLLRSGNLDWSLEDWEWEDA